jgi:hypothetical protein
MNTYIVMFSGGASSFVTASRVRRAVKQTPTLLFCDTEIEDNDLYRFLIESAAFIGGQPAAPDLLERARIIPEVGEPDRHAYLRALATDTMRSIPHLLWLSDGRTPWEVFKDVRFIGNSRIAACSHKLKQDVARAWLDANCDPANTTIYLGIHWSEEERFYGTANSKGARDLWLPWKCESPLCESPLIPANAIPEEIKAAGIELPRLYAMGFSHNNCGGFCVRAGQGHFKRLLATLPARYAHHEAQENAMREFLGKDVSILRDRRGGALRPLTLSEFRARIAESAPVDETDIGGCGCFVTGDDNGSEDGPPGSTNPAHQPRNR